MKVILGIESSCDETACAVVNSDGECLSNIVFSQIDLHKEYGGVVPELASRDHAKKLPVIFEKALSTAKVNIDEINAIAVTNGPGLLGCLLVGLSFAKAIAYAKKIPLIPVDHIKAHLFSIFINSAGSKFPFVGLVVSGGHTSIYLVESFNNVKLIASTVDDAAGEAFDKISRYMGLGYPGGSIINKLAIDGDSNFLKFKKPLIKDNKYSFSFSGIKTSMINYLYQNKDKYPLKDVLASFEYSICNNLVENVFQAAKDFDVNNIVVGGGVAANSRLRVLLTKEASISNKNVFLVPTKYCGDNAVMIANYARFFLNDWGSFNKNMLNLRAFVTSRHNV